MMCGSLYLCLVSNMHPVSRKTLKSWNTLNASNSFEKHSVCTVLCFCMYMCIDNTLVYLLCVIHFVNAFLIFKWISRLIQVFDLFFVVVSSVLRPIGLRIQEFLESDLQCTQYKLLFLDEHVCCSVVLLINQIPSCDQIG